MSNVFIENIEKLNFFEFSSNEEAAANIIANWIETKKSTLVNYTYYANYILLRKNDAYVRSLLASDFILIDGIGMEIYIRKVSRTRIKSVNLTDVNALFLQKLSEKNIGIALYGTTKERIECCAKKLRDQNNSNNIYYYQDGFSPLVWDAIKSKTALFVGLGTPKQEIWIKDNFEKIISKKLLVISVGGFFDFCSGFYKRAPESWRKFKFEWLWRLIFHPSIHYKKNLRNLSIFYYSYIDKFNPQIKKLNIKKYP